MPTGIRSSILTASFLNAELQRAFGGRLGEASSIAARRLLRGWWRHSVTVLGPVSSVRTIEERGARRLVRILGLQEIPDSADSSRHELLFASLDAHGTPVGLVVTTWGHDLNRQWREAVRHGVAIDASWVLAFNGVALRLWDARRTYARRYVEFDLDRAINDDRMFAVFWALARADALQARHANRPAARVSLLDEIVSACDHHQSAVCGSLRNGVEQALQKFTEGLLGSGSSSSTPRATSRLHDAFDQSLTMVYRLLFMLFAEARGLVPTWNPLYRASYTITAVCDRIDGTGPPAGVWDTLQAISRLAHDGCRAGDLTCTPFNGRLFSRRHAPLLDSTSLDDRLVAEALRALTSRSDRPAGRERIGFGDLGVEQLGAVYEHVLDYEPRLVVSSPHAASRPRVQLAAGAGRRKATGTFYTPRTLTDYLVRQTLHPLVEHRTADDILKLRVDPAMGSGAFLVSACRHLASAYETALVRDGVMASGDIGPSDRARFRRVVAQRCLFGVDRNPMAVRLARLSLWLTTLAADRPLTFLDHRLRVGNSLVGASLDDLTRQPPGAADRRASTLPLPLFDPIALEDSFRQTVRPRRRIAEEPADTLEAVREKERLLGEVDGQSAPLARWKSAADLWCAYWFWETGRTPPSKTFGPLLGALLGGASELPRRTSDAWLAHAMELARTHRFFHWTLEFPEAFFDPDGRPLGTGGFDAILGNPPWDVVRADTGERQADRRRVAQLVRFARDSGVYRASGEAHVNVYQLFLERALSLAREGGRIGLVLPGGIATDHGSGALRRLLLERCNTDMIVGFDNRRAVFPIHRGVRFVLLTATRGGSTETVACRFGLQDVEDLDRVPTGARDPTAFPIAFSVAFLKRVSGPSLQIPDVRTREDLALLDRLTAHWPRLGDRAGWNARFGRELNASEDRRWMQGAGSGLPVIAGKHIEPFVVASESTALSIPVSTASRLLDRKATFDRCRLAYRDVSAATNRLTLIAAVVPAGVVTTHTLFCLKTDLDADEQYVLCAILNSLVANYLVRQRVTSHVSAATLARLPAPRPSRASSEHATLTRFARHLATRPADARDVSARLQATVARLYGLDQPDLEYILATFPLIDDRDKAAIRRAFAL